MAIYVLQKGEYERCRNEIVTGDVKAVAKAYVESINNGEFGSAVDNPCIEIWSGSEVNPVRFYENNSNEQQIIKILSKKAWELDMRSKVEPTKDGLFIQMQNLPHDSKHSILVKLFGHFEHYETVNASMKPEKFFSILKSFTDKNKRRIDEMKNNRGSFARQLEATPTLKGEDLSKFVSSLNKLDSEASKEKRRKASDMLKQATKGRNSGGKS